MRLMRALGSALVVPVLVIWIAGSRSEASGPTSGSVAIIRVDPHHQNTILAGTGTAQLFRTRDGANSWTPLGFPAALHATLHSVLIDPIHPQTYMVALSSETPSYSGVFRSVDEGTTWQPLNGLNRKQVWSLASWAVDSRVMAAGTQDGIFFTRDGGETWTHTAAQGSAEPHPVVSLAFDPANSYVLYAGTPHLAWKTIDGGKTWKPIHNGMEEDSDIFTIFVDAINPRRLFAGTCGGIYSSRDGGGTWANLANVNSSTPRTYVIARAPYNPSIIFAGTSGGLLQSTDAGVTWRKVSRSPARSIAFDYSNPRRMFVATDSGILRSEDGGAHFVEASQGLYDRP